MRSRWLSVLGGVSVVVAAVCPVAHADVSARDLGRPGTGEVIAWGANHLRQVGDWESALTASDGYRPSFVCREGVCVGNDLLDGMAAVEGGFSYSLALGADGRVWSWGTNASSEAQGQLGIGTLDNNAYPPRTVCEVGENFAGCDPLTGIKAISTLSDHSLALTDDGSVLAWGGNKYGQLGNNAIAPEPAPVSVCRKGDHGPCVHGAKAVAAGYYHSLALTVDSAVAAWGRNDSGQVGNNSRDHRGSPVYVLKDNATRLDNVVSISAGAEHSVALLDDGDVYAWGNNSAGQLGDGTTTDRLTAVKVSGLPDKAVAVAAGGSHTAALLADGTVYTWGYGSVGRLGQGTTTTGPQPTPRRVCAPGESAPCTTGLKDVTAIDAGGAHTIARLRDGTVVTWGLNDHGQLGDGSTTDRYAPWVVTVPGGTRLMDVTAISAGYYHTLVTRGSAETYLIQPENHDTLALEATTAGATLQPRTGAPHQRWHLRGPDANGYTLVNADTGLCLTAQPGTVGTVTIATCDNSTAQRWTLTPGTPGRINNVGYLGCLDVNGGNITATTAVNNYYNCGDQPNQRWTLTTA